MTDSRQSPEPRAPLIRSDAGAEPASEPDGAALLVSELLARSAHGAAGFADAVVAAWAEDRGVLEDGRSVRMAASCLVRPAIGDVVLVWSNERADWVLSVLERADEQRPVEVEVKGGVTVNAPRITLRGRTVQVVASDFLSHARNRHAIENTRTEHSRLRVSQVETDIRRVGTADERVSGTLLQRAGTWLSSTTRDARLKARTFLFE